MKPLSKTTQKEMVGGTRAVDTAKKTLLAGLVVLSVDPNRIRSLINVIRYQSDELRNRDQY